MNTINENETLFFMHIPKTSGTSINHFIAKNYYFDKHNFHTEYTNLYNFMKAPDQQVNQWKFITGHYNWFITNRIKNKYNSFTIMREPIDQAISWYKQNKKIYSKKNYQQSQTQQLEENRYAIERFSESTFTFSKYIKDPFFIKYHILNFQSKYIGGDDQIINSFCELPLNIQHKNCTERIKDFTFIGMQDQFEKSLWLLCYQYGWKPPKKIPKLNTSEDKEIRANLSEEEVLYLKRVLSLDYKLYNIAKKLFNKKVKGLTYKKVLRKYQKNMNSNYKITDYSENLNAKIKFQDGWYQEEKNCRWSGPECWSEIDFCTNGQEDVLVSLVFDKYLVKKTIEKLEIYINEKKVEYLITGEEKNIYQIIISKKKLRKNKGITSLQFEIPKTMSTQETGMGQETRKIGIPLIKITIKPVTNRGEK